MMQKRPRGGDYGFTVVELMIVISILAIMTGMAGFGLSLANSRDTDQGARTIELALASARQDAASKQGDYVVTIDRVNKMVTVERIVAGTAPVTMLTRTLPARTEISFKDPVNALVATEPDKVSISFDKSSGRLKTKPGSGGVVLAAAGVADDDISEDVRAFRIEVANPSRSKVATVVVVANTGKTLIEYGDN
ncbi:MAG: prepilin-type N-terminal cleavage/methylation domain-containing protein [Lachnospiraceae bacterium]|jgi:prepilin-type N-terminal cleavage/methylation domain-containing protein|nr:prepilin-type N-terminal cleavage/methylation domain-containing protein [Lachnospiraceae bacterium]